MQYVWIDPTTGPMQYTCARLSARLEALWLAAKAGRVVILIIDP